jgi:hypothetical protein
MIVNQVSGFPNKRVLQFAFDVLDLRHLEADVYVRRHDTAALVLAARMKIPAEDKNCGRFYFVSLATTEAAERESVRRGWNLSAKTQKSMILKLLSVAGLGILYFQSAVPSDMAMKLHPIIAGLATLNVNETAVIIIFLVGQPMPEWVTRKLEKQVAKMHAGKIGRIWKKYGIIGLGLLAPIPAGAPHGALLGLLLGAKCEEILLLGDARYHYVDHCGHDTFRTWFSRFESRYKIIQINFAQLKIFKRTGRLCLCKTIDRKRHSPKIEVPGFLLARYSNP